MKQVLSALAFSYAWLVCAGEGEVNAVQKLASACNDLEDGVQTIRPFEGTMPDGTEWPNINVKCVDGWTVLDYTLDSAISKYFSSFQSWTEYAASSSLDDRVSWRNWFLPSLEDSSVQFGLSEDCNVCSGSATVVKQVDAVSDETAEAAEGEESEESSDNLAYFMTGNYIGCLWVTKGVCDMDPDSLQCYECSAHEGGTVYSGLCTHMEMTADTEVYTEHNLCTTNSFNAVPSLGTNGQYCVCYRPESSQMNEAAPQVEAVDDADAADEEDVQTMDTEIKVYAKDFERGTYRITKPGTYVLQEDCELNMNAPSDYDSPNGVDAWYPSSDLSSLYEGADGSFVGAYSMGFFAAFAIESSDVIVDLNGHELKMSKEFHLQQRWFSHVEIGSKAFISGQGPGNFGAFLVESENIVIKNGVLGLSSHHGIHGNSANKITISDVQIKDFEVAGIALNGFEDVTIENVEVGPVYRNVPVMGVYTQARIMLPRMRKVAEETDDTVRFYYRESEDRLQSMAQLEETLENQMDTIFNHVVLGEEYEEDDEVWSRAKALFINPNGIPSASTVYGIFLNSLGASVFALGGAPGNSYNAVVRNVRIHGLINDPWEVPRIINCKGPFNDIVDLTRASDNGMTSLEDAAYQGNAYTDAQFGIGQLSESWSVLSHSSWTDPIISWVEKGQSLKNPKIKINCNNDIMLHVTKGVFGLRLDSIDGFEVENVVIENLQNIGYYGALVCGNYDDQNTGGHRNQRAPMQTGYTGTEIHGMTAINSKGTINNLHVTNVVSARGDATGLQIFPGNEIELGKVSVKDVHAGAYAKSDDAMLYQARPNKMPRGCAVDVWTYFDEDDDTLAETKITFSDDSKISGSCVSGLTACAWDYSEELISDVGACSVSNGNLLDADQIEEGKTYAAIEENNGNEFEGVTAMLVNQEATRDLGDVALAQSLMEADAAAVNEIEEGAQEVVENAEDAEMMKKNMKLLGGLPRKLEVDGASNHSKSSSSKGTTLMWVLIIIGSILLITCMVGLYKKCYANRRVVTSNSEFSGMQESLKTSNQSSAFVDMRKNRFETTYASTASAEYTPLIHTGSAV